MALYSERAVGQVGKRRIILGKELGTSSSELKELRAERGFTPGPQPVPRDALFLEKPGWEVSAL
ncbi:hypothetical protein SKAU_G00310740, partial [Synaphobranchus kaupii]